VIRVSPKTFRAITGVALFSLCVIVLSGALVRLTGSGLGCSDWPRCNATHFVDVSSLHTRIEQINRLFTGVVSASVILAVLTAYGIHPKRRDLVLFGWSLVIGVLAQVVIGGIVVLTGLNPFANMGHFLVSIVLLTCAFVLFRRSTGKREDPIFRPLPQLMNPYVRAMAITALVVVVTGTVVTATGPHAGDEKAIRLGFALTSVARVHSGALLVLIAVLIATFIRVKKLLNQEDSSLSDSLYTLGIVVMFQAAIGYTQYFTGVPVVLVSVHIFGAVMFWLAICNVLVYPSRNTQISNFE